MIITHADPFDYWAVEKMRFGDPQSRRKRKSSAASTRRGRSKKLLVDAHKLSALTALSEPANSELRTRHARGPAAGATSASPPVWSIVCCPLRRPRVCFLEPL